MGTKVQTENLRRKSPLLSPTRPLLKGLYVTSGEGCVDVAHGPSRPGLSNLQLHPGELSTSPSPS